MLVIGNLKLRSNLILAPMAGVSDLPFRLFNRGFGSELAFTEMLNVRSLSYKSERTHEMLSTTSADTPLGVQILGCEDKFIRRALEILHKYKFDILDFNAACPVKKVVRRGEGAGLLREPKKLGGLLKIIVEETEAPVSVKLRTGWDNKSVNIKELARAAEGAGVQAIFIHGRTKTQGYSGSVDYQSVAELKKAVKIPVIASGDVLTGPLAKKMFDETGCDGLLVARGALGNPWVFKEIKEFLRSGTVVDRPETEEIIKSMIKHVSMCVSFYGQRNGIILFRKFFSWYTKGFRGVRPLREKISRAKTYAQVVALIQQCRENSRNFSLKVSMDIPRY